jgi:hypothetical protein
MFDRFIKSAFALAVAIALIASFTVRAHGATVTTQAPPCLKAPVHHKHKTVLLPATPIQTCFAPQLPPPCLEDIPEAIATPHPTYIILEYPAPQPDAAPPLSAGNGGPSGMWGWLEGGRDVVPPRFPGGGYAAPEIDPEGLPTAFALLGMLAAIAAGRRS